MKLPSNFQQWNRGIRGAYLKGHKAFEAGESEACCPYEDKRKDSGRLTWSRAFISAWSDGYRDAQNEKKTEGE
jgi:ribosome modulation factor